MSEASKSSLPTAASGPILEVHPLGPLQCNAYILGCPRTREGVIIDPGDNPEFLAERVRALDLDIKALIHTHTHFDHVGASRGLSERLGAPILIHPDDHELYRLLPKQLELFGFAPGEEPKPVDRFLEDGEVLNFGAGWSLKVIHTPGHTLGSVCLELGERLFSGDTLFRGSVGRTDLGGTSLEGLVQSIKKRLYPLDEDTLVLPGHGPDTQLGVEKRTNPFLK
ncbi:MAG: MBL fold metallo-hydrolase [Planctomycetes bacterium]|nr:MBL fold metallo-hydrolase [Planctomycetota bacterium]